MREIGIEYFEGLWPSLMMPVLALVCIGVTFVGAFVPNGLLEQRSAGAIVTTISGRDNRGRITGRSVQARRGHILDEGISWRPNATVASYTAQRVGGAVARETRNYGYNSRGQLISESYAPKEGASATLQYQYDGGTSGNGLGTRTLATNGSDYEQRVEQISPLARVTREFTTNGEKHYTAHGRSFGATEIKAYLNGMAVGPVKEDAIGDWSVDLKLRPGTYELLVAAHKLFGSESSTTSHFQIEKQPRTIEDSYNGEGELTKRVLSNGQVQTLTWDAFGKLVKVTERDGTQNGYNWEAVYDPFGRRLETHYTPVRNNHADTQQQVTVKSYYDPEVEHVVASSDSGRFAECEPEGRDEQQRASQFLEVGVSVNGAKP